ncbi:uncharacterized protein LOC142979611 [Anticarsia gemmatalis]|uniref:uncharacterized protein LOC142979611 n=1 Tax=Anticarsia gemmatalis TaxID=129554 RepID=UPI003F764A92
MELITLLLVNLALVQGRTDVETKGTFLLRNHTDLEIYANGLGRGRYNPWMCNYRQEPGYQCISCTAALHCFPGNFALLVQCAGFFPYCRSGYCSRVKTEGCNEDYMFAEGTHGPLRVTTVANDETTTMSGEKPTEITDQLAEESISNAASEEMQHSNKVEEIVEKNSTDIRLPSTEKDPRRFF